MNNVGWGVILNNNTTYTGRSFSQFHQFMGGHISNFSDPNSYGEHALYMEALYSLVEGNTFENPVPTDNGDYVKMRGGSSIIRYNMFHGNLSDHVIEYPDMEDSWQFMGVDMNLGVVGDTNCADSVWCSVTSSNITLAELTDNAEALTKDFAYGNVMANEAGPQGAQTIQYGSYSAPNECPPAPIWLIATAGCISSTTRSISPPPYFRLQILIATFRRQPNIRFIHLHSQQCVLE